MFSAYAIFVADCVKRKVQVGMEEDELKELGNDLWTLHDNFTEGILEDPEADVDSYGEDEE